MSAQPQQPSRSQEDGWLSNLLCHHHCSSLIFSCNLPLCALLRRLKNADSLTFRTLQLYQWRNAMEPVMKILLTGTPVQVRVLECKRQHPSPAPSVIVFSRGGTYLRRLLLNSF